MCLRFCFCFVFSLRIFRNTISNSICFCSTNENYSHVVRCVCVYFNRKEFVLVAINRLPFLFASFSNECNDVLCVSRFSLCFVWPICLKLFVVHMMTVHDGFFSILVFSVRTLMLICFHKVAGIQCFETISIDIRSN